MKIKTWIVLLLSLLAFTARAAVIPIKITDFPRTNTIPAQAIFLVAITNSVESTNYGFTYTNLFRQITGAIPAVINSFTNGSNFFIAGSDWTNISGYVRLLGGSTNTARFATNNNRGMLIGDEGIAVSYFGWPADGLSYLSVYDGSAGHLQNRWIHGAQQPSTTNGGYASIIATTGVNPTLTEAFVVLTNGVIASEFDINMQRTGSYLLLGGNVNDGFVGIQHGAQVSTPIGGNLMRAKWGTFDRYLLATNGAVTFFGSATNYGTLYAKSNFVVSGTTLLQSTLGVNGPALFLNGLGSTGITNTIGFQTLGRISLGDDPSDLTTSSNLFRQYGPMHIHDLIYLQHVAIDPGNLLYATAGRNVATVPGVNSTTAGYLAGVTSLIQPQLDSKQNGAGTLTNLAGNPNVATNISGAGNVTVTSNNLGGWTISGTGANPNTATNILGAGTVTVTSNNLGEWTITGAAGVGGGGESMWTNIAQHGVLQTIAGSTNFIGGGRLNAIGTNNVYATVGGGSNNTISADSSFAVIGGGSGNVVSDPQSTVGGGFGNSIVGTNTTIGGGYGNRAVLGNSSGGVAIGGGEANLAADAYVTIAGGIVNSAYSPYSVIGGGGTNTIFGATLEGWETIAGGVGHSIYGSQFATIGGGAGNVIATAALASTIAGGRSNYVQSGVGSDLSAYNFIGGGYSNGVVYPSSFSVIAGGEQNTMRSWHGFIGGGYLNTIQTNALYSAIVGGARNSIDTNSSASTIGGGTNNSIQANAGYSVIGGGQSNRVDGNIGYTVSGGHAVIDGGIQNTVSALLGTIGGGQLNRIDTNAYNSAIGGGAQNAIKTNSPYSVIAGGNQNEILVGANTAVISGGGQNTNASTSSTIGGGVNNQIGIGSLYAVIGGGQANTIGTNATSGMILGGSFNRIETNTHYAAVIGHGVTNSTTGAIELGYFNTNKVRIDSTNLHLIGNMKIKMTNGAFGGYVLTSDDFGNLTLQAVGGGSGGGGGPSSSWIASSNGFGTNTAFYGSVTNYGHLTVNSNLNISSNGMTIYHTAGAPFSIYQHPDNYLGTRDDGFKFAYNLLPSGPVDTNEPSMYLGMEANYDTGVAKFMEVNWDYLSASGIGRRALGYQVDRTNHSAIWQLSGRSFAWVNYTNPANTNLHQLMDLIDTGRLTVYSPPGLSALITAQSQTIDGTGSIPGFAWSEGGVQKWYLWHMGNTDDSLQLFNQGVVNRLTVLQTGNIGIGTNLPTAQLHVVGNNAANALVLQAGTTNKPSLMTLSTNGLFTVPSANIRTNVGTMDVTTNLFVLGTRVTNGTRRIFVGASAQLNAAAAGTAKITLYVENAGSATNRLSVSAGPLASLTTVEALFMAVSPGSIYYFADETSGAGATVALVPETCSVTAF